MFKTRGKFFFRDDGTKFYPKTLPYSPSQHEPSHPRFNTGLIGAKDLTPGILKEALKNGLTFLVTVDGTFIHSARKLAREQRRARDCYLNQDLATFACHPAVLGFVLSQELPKGTASLLRRRLKAANPGCLIGARLSRATDVLARSFADFFYVPMFLEPVYDFVLGTHSWQVLAGDKPLIVECQPAPKPQVQAAAIRLLFERGVAGVTLTAGFQEELTLEALADAPFPRLRQWPPISVVVCAYNGQATIEECLRGVSAIDYPDFEVVVVDDASKDQTVAIAKPLCEQFGFRLICALSNQGLSQARNVGWNAAKGEIIAYLDQDAFPEPDWLRYLGLSFLSSKHAAIGGPNLNPLHAGRVSACIDLAPGGAQIVMATDLEADHIPGCNLAVRRSFLESVGGFDPFYRTAGDDVDFCWRVRKNGGMLGYSPGAVVWHYRRPTVREYLQQQRSYGRGESYLEQKWPWKFNGLGHQTGTVKVLGVPPVAFPLLRQRIYSGRFMNRSLYQIAPHRLLFLTTMPEWNFVLALLLLLSPLALLWKIFLWIPLLLGVGVALSLLQAFSAARESLDRLKSYRFFLLNVYLQLAQPVARLRGRWEAGLTPWRRFELFRRPKLRPSSPS